MERHVVYDEAGNLIELMVQTRFNIGSEKYVALLLADDINSPTFIMKVERDFTGTEKLTLCDDQELTKVRKEYEKLKKYYIQ